MQSEAYKLNGDLSHSAERECAGLVHDIADAFMQQLERQQLEMRDAAVGEDLWDRGVSCEEPEDARLVLQRRALDPQ